MRENSAFETDLRPSKSQVKRDLLAVQHTAERLVSLPHGAVARLQLDPGLRAAIEEYARVRGRPAQRRHLRRLAGLLRDHPDSLRSIETLIGDGDSQSAAEKSRFKGLERWRERLLAEGDAALGELAGEYPQADLQQVRQLTRAAQREQALAKPPAAARKLFRYLRELSEAGPGAAAPIPAEQERSSASLADSRAPTPERLRWQCRRGLLELDLILEAFVDHGYAELAPEQRQAFVRLLQTPDPILLDWLMGQGSPKDKDLSHVVALVRQQLSRR